MLLSIQRIDIYRPRAKIALSKRNMYLCNNTHY